MKKKNRFPFYLIRFYFITSATRYGGRESEQGERLKLEKHTRISHGAADIVAAGGEEELDEPRGQEAPRAGHAHGAPLLLLLRRRRLHARASFGSLCLAECLRLHWFFFRSLRRWLVNQPSTAERETPRRAVCDL